MQGLSLMPAEVLILSLPWWLRYKADNMFMTMLIPSNLSAAAQLKYFQKVFSVEFNDLQRTGITAPFGNVKVKVFGQCLDLKGREKFLDQQTVQSYLGCSHCRTRFPKGCSGPLYGVARRYLPVGHRLRQQIAGPFEYAAPELQLPSPLKDTLFVTYAARQAIERDLKHYLGQKGMPMFASLGNFNYKLMNIPDWAHNVAGMFKWVITMLVGPNGEGASSKTWGKDKDRQHRLQAQKYRIFPEIWVDTPQYLRDSYANALRDTPADLIQSASVTWCKRWFRICQEEIPKRIRVNELRAKILEWQRTILHDGRLQIATGI